MPPTLSPLRREDVERELDAWRRAGDWDSANALLNALRPSLSELGTSLGMLYVDDQAARAVKAALALVNTRQAPTRWKRRNPGLQHGEFQAAPVETFAAIAVHSLFDLASVPQVEGPELSLGIVDRAVWRLQLADVIDVDPLAEFLGVDLGAFDERCASVTEAAATSGRRFAGAGGLGGLFAIGQGMGAAFAAPATAALVAATAVVVGLAAGGVVLTRNAEVRPAPTPTDATTDGSTPEPGPAPTTVAGPGEELLEDPLGPGVEIPGLNVPTVEVDEIRLEDVLPEGVDVRDLVPVEVSPAPVPAPSTVLPPDLPVDVSELPQVPDVTPSAPGELVPGPSELPVPSEFEAVVPGG